MLFYFLCCFVIMTSAFPEGHIDSENVTVAAEHGAGGRIAGGEDPDRGARASSFQAQITREGATFCSGTIVTNRYILTAAHCVEGASPRELTVRIGSNIRGEGMVVPIEKIVQHPEYDYPQNNFDIAYMRTGERIPYSRTIRSAFISKPGSIVPSVLHVTGWGYQEDNQKKLADKIRAVDLPVISNTECQVFYPMMSITKNMICAYSLKDMNKGTCVGDAGDPATANGLRLVGVSSATRGCGPGMAPSVFTHVDAEEIRSFILSGISGLTSQRPGHPAERPQRPFKRPEKHPDERPEGPSERPEEESAKQPERPSKCPEKHLDERPENAVKTPESDSENREECPEKAVKTPESDTENPEECPEKATKTPESDSENREECPEKAVKTPERDTENPEECPEKATKTPENDSENREECPEKAVKTPESDTENPEECPEKASKTPESDSKNSQGCPEKVAKTPAKGSDCVEERPGYASKHPEKPLGEHYEKVPKTPAEGSDSDEEQPEDASNRPAGVLDYPEEHPGEISRMLLGTL